MHFNLTRIIPPAATPTPTLLHFLRAFPLRSLTFGGLSRDAPALPVGFSRTLHHYQSSGSAFTMEAGADVEKRNHAFREPC